MKKKAVIYGLGKRFDENKTLLNQKFSITGYSDQDSKQSEKLQEGEIFIPVEDFLAYEFHKIIICGGGMEAKRKIFYKYMDDINWEDIIFLEDIQRRRITGEEFSRDLSLYQKSNKHADFAIEENSIYPMVNDIGENADILDEHYFMQDICVARKILMDNPGRHYDIGSRIDGFISHLLVFRKDITLIDVRPFPLAIDGLDFIQSDAVNLSEIEDESVESLSSLHAAEHFGLGRYGDPVDAEAFFVAMKSFERVLKWGGKLYLSVPCGEKDTVFFNAHRMFSPHTVVSAFSDMKLLKFEAVRSFCVKETDINDGDALKSLGNYYCGIFTLQKL